MILFTLPLIFNPISFLLVRWLPALYLALWPIIIQTLGRDALLMHAVVLILFMLTCDITRTIMLRLIGFDLISLPAGLAVLAMLISDKGSSILASILPLLGWALTVIEPAFILFETVIIMEMISSFNKWISQMSNIRDENSRDLSTWEPPLTRGSIMTRFLVILITLASYVAAYMIIQESKRLILQELGLNESEMPIQFNQAIAMLVTLQLIAFSMTIYKESGILSETAMVTLAASIPIFIAAWSFYHLKATTASR